MLYIIHLLFTDGFPSGQRGQTVNLLAPPSKVRILLHPANLALTSLRCRGYFFVKKETAKGHKAAPLCTPLGLFLQSAAIVEHGKLLTYTCMLLCWQFNTKPKCDKQKVLQKAAKTPQTCTARRESRYSYTATIGTAFHAQYRSIQK